LSETFSQLSNRVREWIISNYRRAKLNFSNLPHDTADVLEATFPSYSTIDPANRLALFQAVVSTMLMHVFEEPLFVGLPETGPLATLRQIANIVRTTGTGYENWRHATIRSLQERSPSIRNIASLARHHVYGNTTRNPVRVERYTDRDGGLSKFAFASEGTIQSGICSRAKWLQTKLRRRPHGAYQ
jgi:hypothetical protein